MRTAVVCLGLICTAAPAAAQVRLREFGFGAAMTSAAGARGAAQIGAALTLDVQRHGFEVAAGAAAAEEFLSLTSVWRLGPLSYGVGPALHSSAGGTRPVAAGRVALDIPLAPRGGAALRIGARVLALNGGARWSLGAGIALAPFRGGLRLGEDVAAAPAPADVARSWDAVVAQVMLLDDGTSCVGDVMATPTALSIRFLQASQQDVTQEVSRVARILSAGAEVAELVISAPDASWVSAAATAGGFPAERISTQSMADAITIQATRAPLSPAIRSAQR